MAKSKWEQLHAQLSTVLQDIEQYGINSFRSTNFHMELLLFGPSLDSYKDYQNEFSNEDPIDKMHPLYQEGSKEDIVRGNLVEPVESYFKEFLKTTMLNETSQQSLSFRPSAQSTIKMALEKLFDCRINRKFGSYDLFKEWEEQLHSLIFQATEWPKNKQEACLLRMRKFFKEKNYPTKKNQIPEVSYSKTAGEIFREILKKDVTCFDKQTIAKIIQHFLEKFLHNYKDKKSGQIVCILWLLIRLTYEIGDDSLIIEDVIHLSTHQINLNKNSILINKKEIKLSLGLMNLLSILMGIGKGIRKCKLFPDIKKYIFKYALLKAFKEIFPNEAPLFSLDSLLFFPHEFSGLKIPALFLKNVKNPDTYAGKSHDLKVSLLKGI